MTSSRELFEHLKPLLPEWKVSHGHRGNRGSDTSCRPMVYTMPGPTYLPNPGQGTEHSLRLVVLLPTEAFDKYEIFVVPLSMWSGKPNVKNPAHYLRYNTDYVSRLATKVILLPKDTPMEKVAKKAAGFMQQSYDGLCAHFLKSHILGEQKPRRVDPRMVARYFKKLVTEGFGEDTPHWMERFYPYPGDGDAYFDTNIMGSEHQWHNNHKRVQITGILSAQAHKDWSGEEGVKISCFTSAYEPEHTAHWPWRMRSCHTFIIRGMPHYQGFKLAVLSFMEDRVKSRYRYAQRKKTLGVTWDDTLPEGVIPPALLERKTA